MPGTEVISDANGKAIPVGAIVAIHGTRFDRHSGIVMDTTCTMEPEDGPVAVFFDKEVDKWSLGCGFSEIDKWDGKKPTTENYQGCPRIVCFFPEELTVEDGFPLKTRILRLFGKDMWHSTRTWRFPLVPNTHACQFADCVDGVATEKTLVNNWGMVCEIYACTKCHEKLNGMCTESFELKKPLPGAPAV